MSKDLSYDVKIKRTKKGFTMVQNSFIEDSELSWKAKGLFIYILSKPAGWKLNIKGDVVKRSKDGTDSIYSGIKELVELGYISRTKKQTGEVTYHVFEDRSDNDIDDYLLKPDLEKPDLEKPDLEKPDLEKPDVLIRLEDNNTEGSNTEGSNDATSVAQENSKPYIINRLIEHGVSKKLAEEYWHFRVSIKRDRPSNRAITLLINHCNTHNFNLSEAIELAIANGWKGFDVEWARNLKRSQSQQVRAQVSKREAIEANNAMVAEDIKSKIARGLL